MILCCLSNPIQIILAIYYSLKNFDSSKYLYAARHVYIKKGFVDISRYNNNHRADVFMEKYKK